MSEKKIICTTAEFEDDLKNPKVEKYILRLYVTGLTLKKILEVRLKGRYELEVIDIHQQPERVKTDKIIVTPTLIKHLPAPVRRIIGDLSNTEHVLIGLDLEPLESKKEP